MSACAIDGTCEEVESASEHLGGAIYATPRPKDIFTETFERGNVHRREESQCGMCAENKKWLQGAND